MDCPGDPQTGFQLQAGLSNIAFRIRSDFFHKRCTARNDLAVIWVFRNRLQQQRLQSALLVSRDNQQQKRQRLLLTETILISILNPVILLGLCDSRSKNPTHFCRNILLLPIIPVGDQSDFGEHLGIKNRRLYLICKKSAELILSAYTAN